MDFERKTVFQLFVIQPFLLSAVVEWHCEHFIYPALRKPGVCILDFCFQCWQLYLWIKTSPSSVASCHHKGKSLRMCKICL